MNIVLQPLCKLLHCVPSVLLCTPLTIVHLSMFGFQPNATPVNIWPIIHPPILIRNFESNPAHLRYSTSNLNRSHIQPYTMFSNPSDPSCKGLQHLSNSWKKYFNPSYKIPQPLLRCTPTPASKYSDFNSFCNVPNNSSTPPSKYYNPPEKYFNKVHSNPSCKALQPLL